MKILIDLLLFVYNFIWFLCIYFSLFIFQKISIEVYVVLSFVTTVFYTKLVIDKQDLTNKIFELKKLIKTLTKK